MVGYEEQVSSLLIGTDRASREKTVDDFIEQMSDTSMRYLEYATGFDSIRFPKPPQYRRETPKVQNNEPCTCGSGLKYKKCCKN